MRRLGLVALGLIAVGWAGVVGAEALGDPTDWVARWALVVVALLTVVGHLGVGWAALGSRAAEAGPGWMTVQVERYRRLATRFAAWGLGAASLALGLGLVGPSAVAPGWLLILASGINLGMQPGLLCASGWAIMARGRLVGSVRPAA